MWVKRLDGTPAYRLTFADTLNLRPAWTPDRDSLLLNGDVLRTRRADGSGVDATTWSDPRSVQAPSWSPDGQWLIYRTNVNQPGDGDIFAVRPEMDSVARPLVSPSGGRTPIWSREQVTP